MNIRWECPKCGHRLLEVIVEVAAVLTQTADNFETDLDDARHKSHIWGENSPMFCLSCSYSDIADAFEVQVHE